MRVRVWGCRGSLATPGRDAAGYGGNTSCVEVRTASGRLIVLDGGTGIRLLGLTVEPDVTEIDILLTHMHLDHVEGLGFFAPFFDPARTIRFWGPRPGELSLADQVALYLSPPFFPRKFGTFGSKVEFHEVWSDTWSLDGVRISSAPVEHPGPTVGYRLEENGRVLAYIPDNELGLKPEAGAELAAGADVLFHDAQYTREEYDARVGWGHSAIDDFAAYVERAKPGRALMFHHDPTHGSADLERMLSAAQGHSNGVPVELASEAMDFTVGAEVD
jgi:phosphoribosyl 1,2-cyclic phosphodiesterase